MLGPEHVGQRVVVRIRLTDAAPGRRFRDVTGELIEADADRLRVLPPAGTAVTVAAANVEAARVIPPRPTPFSEILELERLLAASWPAVETENLGGWLLRYSDGFTKRANSVLALAEPDGGLDRAIAAAERWYADRDAPTLITVVAPIARRLDEELASRGWSAVGETAVMTKAAAPLQYRGEASIVHELQPPMLSDLGQGKPGAARKVLGSGPNRACAKVVRAAENGSTGALVARGRAALEGGTAVLSGIGTLSEYRRQGLGTEILDALSAWAAEAGAERLALQVETENEAALAMYGRLGFKERYRYFYRRN